VVADHVTGGDTWSVTAAVEAGCAAGTGALHTSETVEALESEASAEGAGPCCQGCHRGWHTGVDSTGICHQVKRLSMLKGVSMDVSTYSLFGLWLHRRRRVMDLSRKELASRTGCSVSMLRKLESDQRRPSKGLARALARALEVAPDEHDAFVAFARSGWADAPPATPDLDLEAPWRRIQGPSANGRPGGGKVPGSAAAVARNGDGQPRLPTAPRFPEALLTPRLVGRGRLLERMEQAWSDGLTIILKGPGGIGKSRLMQEFASAHGPWIANEGHPGDRILPLSTVARLFRKFAAAEPEVLARLTPWIRLELSRFLPELGPAAAPPIENEAARMRFFEAAYQATAALTRRCATVVIDDLQYFDPLSYELGAWGTGESVRRGESPTRTIASFRPAEIPAAYAAAFDQMIDGGLAVMFDVDPLDEAGVAELLRQLRVPAGALSLDEVLRVTGGSPIYVIETVKGWWETRGLPPVQGERGSLSSRAGAVIHERLMRLEVGDLRVAQAIALLDDHASIDVLSAMTREAPERVTERLSRLEDAKLVLDLKIIHDVVAECIVSTLSRPDLRYLHARAANALADDSGEPARVAHHFELAGQPREALEWRLEAAARALANGSRTEARAWLEDLNDRVPPGTPAAARTGVLLGRARLPSDLAGATRAFSTALRSARELALPGMEAASLAGLAHAAGVRGDRALARTHEEAAFQVAEALPDLERARVLRELGEVRWALGDYGASEDRSVRAVDLDPDRSEYRLYLARAHWQHGRFQESVRELLTVLRRDPESARLTGVLHDLGRAYWAMGRLEPALGWLRRALSVWSDSGDLFMEGRVREILAAACASRGWIGRAETELVRAASLFQRYGARGRLAVVASRRARLHMLLGRFAEAERICEEALDVEGAERNPYQGSMVLAVTGVARAKAGREAEAREVVERAEALAEASRHPLRRTEALRCAAEVLRSSEPVVGLRKAEAALRIAERHHMREEVALGHYVLARQPHALEATHHARQALSIADDNQLLAVRAIAARHLAGLGEAGMEGRAQRAWLRLETDWNEHVGA